MAETRAAVSGLATTSAEDALDLAALGWVWPAEPFRLVRPFVAPAHEYGPGHRGIDLDLSGGEALKAPADGVVAFSGSVAGRGILTIDHGGGLVTTLEPVASELVPGAVVARGDRVATLAAGGHATAGTVHLGVRLDGQYINPLLLLGEIPRAVLLPCC
ncbi:M23 family metallopeptidase [Microbacterium sp. 1P10UB]|uniref:murein hydrolase activator EnvC family protein n=1 Tax=unclassified Microbacterium TaxID=2609290 RepID=UPI0039A383C2